MTEINKGRRTMLKAAGLMFAAVCIDGISSKLGAKNSAEADGAQPMNRAKYVEANCHIAQKKGKCGKCVPSCPTKAITLAPSKSKKGISVPHIDTKKCVGCGKCVRICPATPKALEIWDLKSNKKIM